MPSSTYFIQGCPACGRRLRIRVEYLGKSLVCQHCQRRFDAVDPATRCGDSLSDADALMQRVDQLLQSVVRREPRDGCSNPR